MRLADIIAEDDLSPEDARIVQEHVAALTPENTAEVMVIHQRGIKDELRRRDILIRQVAGIDRSIAMRSAVLRALESESQGTVGGT